MSRSAWRPDRSPPYVARSMDLPAVAPRDSIRKVHPIWERPLGQQLNMQAPGGVSVVWH